jgi:zinc transport system ATP-binding protein
MTQTPAPVLQLEDVGAAYDGRTVLSGVSLSVAAGELLVLLGANGSGKSTLVRTVLGLTPVAAGSVSLFGQPQQRFHDWARVGYVPQRAGATSGVPATVREVVAAGRLPRMRRFARSGAADRRAVSAALEVVGLSDRARDSIATLSGGQQQRVLIARALACEPELLILDEPTSGVDAAVQVGLADTFARLLADGIAILLVAHELGPIAPLTERAVVLRDGRVVHDGPPPAMDHLHGLDPEHAHPPHDPHAHHHHSMTGWAL